MRNTIVSFVAIIFVMVVVVGSVYLINKFETEKTFTQDHYWFCVDVMDGELPLGTKFSIGGERSIHVIDDKIYSQCKSIVDARKHELYEKGRERNERVLNRLNRIKEIY